MKEKLVFSNQVDAVPVRKGAVEKKPTYGANFQMEYPLIERTTSGAKVLMQEDGTMRYLHD